jgi:hypothetical protein
MLAVLPQIIVAPDSLAIAGIVMPVPVFCVIVIVSDKEPQPSVSYTYTL